MKNHTRSEIEQMVKGFRNKTLPKEKWTHEAHLIVAIWYNYHLEFQVALEQVRRGIIEYNEATGTENSHSSGYHETLTLFWMIHTRNYLKKLDNPSLELACNQFLNAKESARGTPLGYYTRQLLFSTKARKTWVNGDLKAISLVNSSCNL